MPLLDFLPDVIKEVLGILEVSTTFTIPAQTYSPIAGAYTGTPTTHVVSTSPPLDAKTSFPDLVFNTELVILCPEVSFSLHRGVTAQIQSQEYTVGSVKTVDTGAGVALNIIEVST